MAEQIPGTGSRFDLKKGLDYASTIIGLLAPAALFYVVGYVINQAYLFNVGLNATFWFNEFFYREAGGKFLLEIVGAVMLLPHVVFLLSAALFLFFPTPGYCGWRDRIFGDPGPEGYSSELAARVSRFLPKLSAQQRDRVFWTIALVALAIVLVLIRVASLDPYDPGAFDLSTFLKNQAYWLFADFYILPGRVSASYTDAKPSMYAAAMLFAFAIPLIFTLCGLAFSCFRGTATRPTRTPAAETGELRPRRALGFVWLGMAVVLGGYVAVTYGASFYDFVAARVVDTRKCLPLTKEESAKQGDAYKVLECYLVGRYDKWYILLGWEPKKEGNQNAAPIYIKQVEAIEPFAIFTGAGLPVRGILKNAPPETLSTGVVQKLTEDLPTPTARDAGRPGSTGTGSKGTETGR